MFNALDFFPASTGTKLLCNLRCASACTAGGKLRHHVQNKILVNAQLSCLGFYPTLNTCDRFVVAMSRYRQATCRISSPRFTGKFFKIFSSKAGAFCMCAYVCCAGHCAVVCRVLTFGILGEGTSLSRNGEDLSLIHI